MAPAPPSIIKKGINRLLQHSFSLRTIMSGAERSKRRFNLLFLFITLRYKSFKSEVANLPPQAELAVVGRAAAQAEPSISSIPACSQTFRMPLLVLASLYISDLRLRVRVRQIISNRLDLFLKIHVFHKSLNCFGSHFCVKFISEFFKGFVILLI